jgi:hypothetical protein
MAAHPHQVLAANPHYDDYLHNLTFIPNTSTSDTSSNGILELGHGECQAMRGEFTAHYQLSDGKLILSNIQDHYEHDQEAYQKEKERKKRKRRNILSPLLLKREHLSSLNTTMRINSSNNR